MNQLYKLFFIHLLLLGLIIPTSLLASSTADNDPNDPTNPMVLLHKKAPGLVGKAAKGKGLIKLSNLLLEFSFKKDSAGKLIEKNGKFIPVIRRNVVVISFFSVTCIPCIREIPTYNKLAVKYKNTAKMIYANIDADVTIAKIRNFINKRKIKVPMMLPNQKNAIENYRVYSLPRIVIIAPDGKIAFIIKGFKEDLSAQLSELIDSLLEKTS